MKLVEIIYSVCSQALLVLGPLAPPMLYVLVSCPHCRNGHLQDLVKGFLQQVMHRCITHLGEYKGILLLAQAHDVTTMVIYLISSFHESQNLIRLPMLTAINSSTRQIIVVKCRLVVVYAPPSSATSAAPRSTRTLLQEHEYLYAFRRSQIKSKLFLP
jgi:hypothetical protein